MILENKVSRCAIFLFYDKDGIVDEYIVHFLKALKNNVDNILVVSNGEIEKLSKIKLEKVADEVLERENVGMDIGGYKAGVAHLGFEKLSSFDEVILLNYTFFGPLYPLEEMFEKMNQKDLDFWGITSHAFVENDPFGTIKYGFLPKHIQSYFLVLRKSLFASKDFQDYWEKLKLPLKYTDSITQFEAVFTKIFEDLGYKWEAYIDAEEYDEIAYAPGMYCAKSIIEEKRCPVIKRRSFFHDYKDFFDNTCGESSIIAYEYIKDNLDYDVDLIWENILRLENNADINKAMHLNYFLSSEEIETVYKGTEAAFLIYVNTDQLLGDFLRYINNIPEKYFKIIVTNTKENEIAINKIIKDVQIIVDENADCYEYALLNTVGEKLLNYDITCIINVSNLETEKPYSNGFSWLERNLKNTIPSETYINNVIGTFENDPYLGLLSPCMPNHGIYFENMHTAWSNEFEKAKLVLQELNINLNIDVKKTPVSPVGGSCWIRSCILKEVLGYPDKDVFFKEKTLSTSLFGLLLPLFSQSKKYYAGWLMSNEYASIEFTNLEYMIRETNKRLFEKLGVGSIYDITKRIEEGTSGINKGYKYYVKKVIKKVFPKKLNTLGKRFYLKYFRRK